jgi:hypothetical protein
MYLQVSFKYPPNLNQALSSMRDIARTKKRKVERTYDGRRQWRRAGFRRVPQSVGEG